MDNSKLSRPECRRKKYSKEQTLPGRVGSLGKMCPGGADVLGQIEAEAPIYRKGG